MPTLTIDNQSVTVPEGTNVLEAAQRLGIVIPHFCYHEALGAVGSCRLCAMTFLEGPVKGVQMACMVEAKDEMVVSSADPEATQQRSHVIEWLMTHHPHDCPVCDEGGECQLQDLTIAGGHSVRRYRGPKRTYRNQDLGPFIEQEMNRCIACYRCVRTYQDYCGGDDFGALGSRNRVFFGRFSDGRLESPFSGNLVDVCPTGVLTDKTFRFKTRYWDLEEAPSVCPHCSLGCATVPGGRYRELQRTRAGVNRQTNGFFICDRGRFGYGHVNHPQRPRNPRLHGAAGTWSEVAAALADQLGRIAEAHGSQSLAFVTSPRASLEAAALLRRWAEQLGSRQIAFDPHPQSDRAARITAARLEDKARSLEEIRRSDLIVLVGSDPYAEAPLLALALRQAAETGATVAVIDPRPVELPCAAAYIPLPPELLPAVLSALAGGDCSNLPRAEASLIEGLCRQLSAAQRPVLVGGASLLGERGASALLDATEALSTPERPCGAAVLLNGPNSFGGALLAGNGPDFDALLEAVLSGEVKALVCLEADPWGDHPDPGRVEAALSRLELLAVADCLPTQAAGRAGIFLPTAATAEAGGTFVNQEGRMQRFAPVLAPGLPIRVTGEAGPPPRTFRPDTPGDLPRPAWQLLAQLCGAPGELSALHAEFERLDPRLAGLNALEPGGEGARVAGAGQLPPPSVAPMPHCVPGGTLRLLAVDTLFGSERLCALSPPLETSRPAPFVLIHPADAAELSLGEAEAVRLNTPLGHLPVQVRLSSGMARGLAIVPRLWGTPLETLVPGGPPLECVIEKGGGDA